MKTELILIAFIVPWIAGCASVHDREEQSIQPTSLYEITLQKPEPGTRCLRLDSAQVVKFERRPEDLLAGFSESLQLPAGEYRPLGQTAYGIFYEAPAKIKFEKSHGGLGGIVIPASGRAPKVWVADFHLVATPEETAVMLAQAYSIFGWQLTSMLASSSPMLAGKEKVVLLRYFDGKRGLEFRLE